MNGRPSTRSRLNATLAVDSLQVFLDDLGFKGIGVGDSLAHGNTDDVSSIAMKEMLIIPLSLTRRCVRSVCPANPTRTGTSFADYATTDDERPIRGSRRTTGTLVNDRVSTSERSFFERRHRTRRVTDVGTKVCAMDAGCLHPAWRVTAHYANAKPNV